MEFSLDTKVSAYLDPIGFCNSRCKKGLCNCQKGVWYINGPITNSISPNSNE